MDSAGITVYSKCLEFQIASISIVLHCFENPIFREKNNFQPAITREPVRILRNGQRHLFSHIKNYINRYQTRILKFCPPPPPKKNPYNSNPAALIRQTFIFVHHAPNATISHYVQIVTRPAPLKGVTSPTNIR